MYRSILVGLAASVLFAAPALAHSGAGAEHSFLIGFAHPLFGWDHLMPMMAVGLWAGLAGRQKRWIWPVAFLVGMSLGGALGIAGLELPAVESAILASILLLGVATALALKPPVVLGSSLILIVGLAHGNAHGLETTVSADGVFYAAGFLLATAVLHGAGLIVAYYACGSGKAWIPRAVGAASGIFGSIVALI
jgi:urease accessory protein